LEVRERAVEMLFEHPTVKAPELVVTVRPRRVYVLM
jgi:hypothetical protein